MADDNIKKRGAGFFMISGGEVLLLLRSASSGNPNTWGLPGGNIDEGETPIDAALREAVEELGKPMSDYTIKAEIRTVRGKNRHKVFTVFVVEISTKDKLHFHPELNEEHEDFKWYDIAQVPEIENLHPIVETLYEQHQEELTKALES